MSRGQNCNPFGRTTFAGNDAPQAVDAKNGTFGKLAACQLFAGAGPGLAHLVLPEAQPGFVTGKRSWVGELRTTGRSCRFVDRRPGTILPPANFECKKTERSRSLRRCTWHPTRLRPTERCLSFGVQQTTRRLWRSPCARNRRQQTRPCRFLSKFKSPRTLVQAIGFGSSSATSRPTFR